MPRYKVGVAVMTPKDIKTATYTIDAGSMKKAELEARKRYADYLKLKSIRNVSAFGVRV
jgi:hypothetical protein